MMYNTELPLEKCKVLFPHTADNRLVLCSVMLGPAPNIYKQLIFLMFVDPRYKAEDAVA